MDTPVIHVSTRGYRRGANVDNLWIPIAGCGETIYTYDIVHMVDESGHCFSYPWGQPAWIRRGQAQ